MDKSSTKNKPGIKVKDFYRNVYDKLYQVGYHAKGKNHGVRLVPYIVGRYEFESIVDVGCSNGYTVKAFGELNKKAYGIDVAGIAIRYATEKYGIKNCRRGSVLNLPYKDNSFDAVFSCDMLEHLKPRDVEKGISEIKRVAGKYLFLHISPEIEGNREFLLKAEERWPDVFNRIKNLHITVMPLKWWINEITKDGGATFLTNNEGLLVFKINDISKKHNTEI